VVKAIPSQPGRVCEVCDNAGNSPEASSNFSILSNVATGGYSLQFLTPSNKECDEGDEDVAIFTTESQRGTHYGPTGPVSPNTNVNRYATHDEKRVEAVERSDAGRVGLPKPRRGELTSHLYLPASEMEVLIPHLSTKSKQKIQRACCKASRLTTTSVKTGVAT
jgi:hypothetical protein